MCVQVALLWIAKYPSQLLAVWIWIQLDWAKRYEIQESWATNRSFWAGSWNCDILSLDTAMCVPTCTNQAALRALWPSFHGWMWPWNSFALTWNHWNWASVVLMWTNPAGTSALLCFPSPANTNFCTFWIARMVYQVHQPTWLTAAAAKVSCSSWTNRYGQRWGLRLAADTCLELGKIYIFRLIRPVIKMWVSKCGCSTWLQLYRSGGLVYTLVMGLVSCEMGIWNLAAISLEEQRSRWHH